MPQGAANAHVESYRGFGLRVVMDYDISKKQDVISIDTLYGVKCLDPNRAVLITTGATKAKA
ncbi:P22 phage major capsid protein family protein [Nonomuraea antimicrobica]